MAHRRRCQADDLGGLGGREHPAGEQLGDEALPRWMGERAQRARILEGDEVLASRHAGILAMSVLCEALASDNVKDMLHKSARPDGVFAHRDMRLVVPARAISFLGDSITFVVLLLKVSEAEQPLRLSILLAAFSLPLFAMAPVAGRIVDEFDSRTVLLVAGAAQASASLALAFAPSFAALVAAMAVLQTAQSITGPAWSALVPRIVGEALIGRAV